MATRSFWKGYLKLSLVTCPVAMAPAVTENEKVRFHTLNRKTGNRIVSRYVDSVTGGPVDEDDEVKGYERGENEYVVLEDEELDAVALDSTRTIDIEMFVPHDSIAWIWFDTPHYLTPDDPVGEEAYCVIRDAMVATGMIGVSRLVMYRRERAVMLEPRGRGIVLWTLRFGDEVRDEQEYFGDIETRSVEPKLMTLIEKLIDKRRKPWSPSMVSDPVQEKLLDIIASRKKGRRRPAKEKVEEGAKPSNVISIMDALRKSISQERKTKRR